MFKRVLIFLAAAALFAAGVILLAMLSGVPSGKERKTWDQIRAEEKSLARSFDVLVLRSGFQKKGRGQGDIYVPAVLVQIINRSKTPSKPSVLSIRFLQKDRTFCRDQGRIPSLAAEEIWEGWLKCVELTGFGSVVWGVSLPEMATRMDYEISLESGRAAITIAKDRVRPLFL